MIRKLLFPLALLLFFSNRIKSQNDYAEDNFYYTKFYADVYYGFPNLWKGILESAINSSTSNGSLTHKSFGPMGIRLEYRKHKVVGVLLEAYYATDIVEYVEPNSSAPGGMLYEKLEISRPRVIGRFNFHFTDADDDFDPYGFIGLGYNFSTFQYSSNYYQNTTLDYSIFNIAFKTGFGLRYFVIPSLGLNFELSLGGPLIMLGISGRF